MTQLTPEDKRAFRKLLQPNIEEMSSIPGLRVAVRMLAAVEISGDYFDIVNISDGSTIFSIGDITGHGLEASIVAMLVKTNVREIFQSPGLDLKTATSILNGVIYQNLKNEMRDESNLTFGLLRYQNGEMEVTGYHEDILHRHSNVWKEISTSDLGMNLGLVEDISPFINSLSFPFQKEDILFLSTDGLWEAKNIQGDFFSKANFYDLFSRLESLPMEGMLDGFLELFFIWKGSTILDDDISLVLIHSADM